MSEYDQHHDKEAILERFEALRTKTQDEILGIAFDLQETSLAMKPVHRVEVLSARMAVLEQHLLGLPPGRPASIWDPISSLAECLPQRAALCRDLDGRIVTDQALPMRLTLTLLLSISLLACGDDDGGTDAMVAPDASATDASATDASATDAPVPDVPSEDTSMADANDDAGLSNAGILCAAYESRDVRCGEEPEPLDVCLAEQECIVSLLRADAIEPFATCNEELACMMSDDGCSVAETIGLTTSDAARAYMDSCGSRRTECMVEVGTTFNDDFCFASIASDETVAAVDACLAQPCTEIRACLRSVLRCM